MESSAASSGCKLDYRDYGVLYIDDEPGNLEAFQDEFEEFFTILTASSGPEGLKIVQQRPVQLVLADQRMPKMSGVQVLEEIRRLDPRILRILVTAYADIEVVIDAINKGQVYRYFRKPWEHEDIRTGIMRGLDHYQADRDRERLNAERIENMKKMIRSNRLAAVGTMVAGLVHEIRNPMVAIQSFFQLLPKKWDDKDFLRRYLEIAQGEANRIESLLENMLGFARPARPILRACDLNALVERNIQLLEFQARRKGIQVDFQKDPDLPPAFADPSQMLQVIQNLGLNAIQAMESKGVLLFRTSLREQEKEGFWVGLEVQDTGPGIRAGDLEKVFDPFYTTKADGTGLGLSIAYQIVNEHGGRLEVESEPGKGTVFRVCLPVFDAEKQTHVLCSGASELRE
ncbi:MAG: ATP-binding protein [bacterium]